MAIRATTATANTTATKQNLLVGLVVLGVALAPAAALLSFGIFHVQDGIARDSAVPVPVYMVAGIPVPKVAYVNAAQALARANPGDGKAMLSAAEARWHAGERGPQLIQAITEGMKREPASARGWALLAQAAYPQDRNLAARALAQALLLAPSDYWLAGQLTQDGALLWDSLGSDTKALVLRHMRLMWQEESLHPQFFQLLRTGAGAALVSRAFAPADVRAVNRWYSRELRRRHFQ